ncbi:MAG: class II aldolase/adducin family protein [Actinomycetota bacterium]|nr:class II aldolase/adducin family protein [Actinomycetota bacterium]
MEREREAVAAAGRELAAEGLVIGTSGNLSLRTDERVAVTPTGAVLAELEAADVAVVGLDGGLIAGDLAPTSELGLHLGIYEHYGSRAVVHTHAPMATALGLVLDELPCVHYEMLGLGGAVRVAPYATFGSAELAQAVLDALADRTAALMANHGAVTRGPDLAAAVQATKLLEWACALYWRAAAIGTPRTLDPSQLEAVVDTIAALDYGAPRSAGPPS